MVTNKNIKNWFALYVNVRHEKRICQRFKETGIECYLPIVKKVSQWSDRKKKVESPLISGYVFVFLAKEEMDKPRYENGVLNYVRFNGQPAIIREEEMEGLKYFVEHGFILDDVDEQELKIGDRIEFKLSEFKAFTANIEKFVGENFVIVTFDAMAKNFRLKVALSGIKKKEISK